MPRRLDVDTKELLKVVEDGASPKEIMKRFGIKTRAQLDRCYINALVEAGKAKPLGKKKNMIKELRVNGKGALVVPKSVMEVMGLDPGDTVEVKQTKSTLILKPKVVSQKAPDAATDEDKAEDFNSSERLP